VTEGAPFNVEDHPELAAILRTGKRSKFRLSEHICEGCNRRLAEVFTSPAGPILLGRGLLPTVDGIGSAAGGSCAT
jgi:hypothetical protein